MSAAPPDALGTRPSYDAQPAGRRLVGLGAVALLHLLIFYALVSGLARDAVEVIRKPLEPKLIAEPPPPPPPPPPPTPPPKQIVKPPPPPVAPPPPPFVPPPEVAPPPVVAPAPITTVPEPPKVEYKIEPPPPPSPPAPEPAPPAPARQDIGVVCPTQVRPELPRRALQDGISGVVRAQARIVGGVVKEVTILSGPRVFHAAVRTAMLQYKCQSNADEVVAVQEFSFKVE